MKRRKASFIVIFLVLTSTLCLSVAILPGHVRATTRYVGGGGPGNYTMLYDVLIDANPGDTIYVYNGTYYERINVNKPLTLIGEDRNTTIIHGNEAYTVVHVTADSVNITGFTVTKSGTGLGDSGIKLDNVKNCYIASNNIYSNRYGIYLTYSGNNIVTNNFFSWNSRYGIHLSYSTNNNITNNEMVGDGIYIYGDSLKHWNSHTIHTSNTVNDKPVYYRKNTTGGTVPLGAGQVILANCTNVLVENQNVSDGSVGIELGFSSGNTIANNTASYSDRYGLFLVFSNSNTIANNTANYSDYVGIFISASNSNTIANNTASWNSWYNMKFGSSHSNIIANNTAWYSDYHGIHFTSSNSNTISGNAVSFSDYYGIFLSGGKGNTISDNAITMNGVYGIVLSWSEGNTIIRNKILWNQHYAIYVEYSSNNMIYHNDFLFLVYKVFDDTKMNSWDNGYPSGGNHYSDYTGVDEKFGPNQDQPGSDGIGDTAYYTQGGSCDFYPLMDPPPPPSLPPSAPQYLQAFAGNQQVTLTWSAPLFDGRSAITNYGIYRGTASEEETFLAEIGNVLTYTDEGLTNGQIYYYKVSAKNAVGEGSQSNEVNATPANIPGEPLNLIAVAGNEEITLTWAQPTDNGGFPITNYTIYRGTISGGETSLTEVGDVLTYTDTGLTNDQTYYYKVSAVNVFGEGPQSNEVSATPVGVPGPPTSVTASPGNGEVILNWSSPVSDGGVPVTNYAVYRGTSPSLEVFLVTLGDVPGFVDTGLMNGVAYFYKVAAINSVGEGPNSTEVSATPFNRIPECNITNPTSGTTVSGSYAVAGTASDTDGTVERVEIRIDDGPWTQANGTTSWSYQWNTTTLDDGNHTIYARSFDGMNNSYEVNVTVVVDNAVSPPPPDEDESIFEQAWFWVVVALVIIVVVAVLLLLVRKRKQRREGDQTSETREPS